MARYTEDIIYRLAVGGADVSDTLNGYADAADRAHESLSDLIDIGGTVGDDIAASVSAATSSLEELGSVTEEAQAGLSGTADAASEAGTGLQGVDTSSAALTAALIAAAGSLQETADELRKMREEAEDTDEEVEELGSSLGGLAKTGGVVVAGLGALAAGMYAVTKASVDQINNYNDLSARSSVAASDIQGLTAAFIASGQSASAAEGIINRWPTLLLQAQQGTTTLVDALGGIGVSVEDVKDGTVGLGELASALQGIEDDGERATAAVALFGKQGGRLLQALANNAGLEDFVAFTDEWGTDVGPQASAEAAKFQQALSLLQVALDGTLGKLTAASGGMSTFTTLIGVAASGVVYLGSVGTYAIDAITERIEVMLDLGDSISTFWDGILEGMEALRSGNSLDEIVDGLTAAKKTLESANLGESLGEAAGVVLRGATPLGIVDVFTGLGNAMDVAGEDAQAFTNDMQALLDKLSGGTSTTPPIAEGALSGLGKDAASATSAVASLVDEVERLVEPDLTELEEMQGLLGELGATLAAVAEAGGGAEEIDALTAAMSALGGVIAQLEAEETAEALDDLVSSVEALTAPKLTRLQELEGILLTLQVASSESEEAFWRLSVAMANVEDALAAEKLRETNAALAAMNDQAAKTQDALAGALGVKVFTDALGGLLTLRSGFKSLFDELRDDAGGLRDQLREAGSGLLDGLRDSEVGSFLSGLADGFRDKLSAAIGGAGGDAAGGGDGGGGGLLAVAGSIPEPVTQAVLAVLGAANQLGAAGSALEAELAAAKESGDTDRVSEIESAIAQYGSASGAAVAEAMQAGFSGLLEGLKALPEVLGSVVIPELIKMAPDIVRGIARAVFLLPFEIAGAIFNGIGDIFEEGLGNALRRWWEGLLDGFIDLITDALNPFSRDSEPASDADIAAQVAAYEANQAQSQEQAAQSSFLGSNASSARSSSDAQLRKLYGMLLPDAEPGGGLTVAELNRAAGGGARRALAGRRERESGGRSVSVTINTDIADPDTMRRTTRRLERTESTLRRVPRGSLGSGT